MAHSTLDGILYDGMLRAGAANLHRHRQQVNDLNVFPIPDGDTGDNMMLTVEGGVHASHDPAAPLSEVSERSANGMLLGARGNSGVILSQFFAGLAEGFRSCDAADVPALEKAFACGVGCAYESVMNPTVGTILTVVKDAAGYAAHADCSTVEEYFEAFIAEAKRSLDRTPDLLPVLKEAGVVDSGGAGLIHIVEG
ncbi:MAG: DAK2 domain-containing protein, partial [Clostridia bacterium]|nr:DAK2 domain-containing protein [Clostridia bacterium]